MTAPGRAVAWPPLPPPLRGVRAAFVFLTRIPAGGFPYSEPELRWAPAHFPLVGACVGAAAAAVLTLLLPLGQGVAAALSLVAAVALTGALHEDGLADTFDALGGSNDRDGVLRILKDSRVGAFGATALALSLLVRFSLLAELEAAAPAALVAAHAAARTGPVWLLSTMPYVSGTTSKSAAFARVGMAQTAAATGWMLVVAGGCGLAGASWPALGAGILGVAVVTLAAARWFRARAGGVTGDFLGAAEQLSEIAFLVTVLAWGRAAG